ncbi:MAG: FkbM family methyltransferase [Anaerolineae bacterium]|nr:FkbM family methyltransferase [Anaerolineae bacterium]
MQTAKPRRFDSITPRDPDHVSHTILYKQETAAQGFDAPFKRVITIAKELGHSHIDILKLDIEGAEYDVIDDVLKSGVSVGQILIEFHHRFAGLSIRKTINTTKKLQKHGYKLFHVSDTADELSFIRG